MRCLPDESTLREILAGENSVIIHDLDELEERITKLEK